MPRHVLHRDIETRSTLDLTGVGAWRYASEPTTGVWCVGYTVDDAPARIWIPEQPIPEEFHVAAHDSGWLIVAHNDAFERAVEELILTPRYGWPIVPIQQHVCTMAMVLASALPGSLDGAAEVLNSPFRKDAEGQRLMRKMARPRKPRAGEDPNGTLLARRTGKPGAVAEILRTRYRGRALAVSTCVTDHRFRTSALGTRRNNQPPRLSY